MKKILALVLAVTMILLTGCTALVPSPHGEIADSDAVAMYTQFPVYDKDMDRIQVILENGGEINLEYGTEWAVEKKQGDIWMQIPFRPEYAWTQPLLTLMPGGTDSFYVSMDMLDHTLKDGQYRVVKEVSGTVYAAEFSVGESDVSADSPFGYVPLEELPMDYSAEDAVRDGVMVLLPDGTIANADRFTQFLTDMSRYVDTQIRFAYSGTLKPESLTLEDVILTKPNGNTPRFTFRTDWRRVIDSMEEIQTEYHSYLQWDDSIGDFYLADAFDTDNLRKLLFVPSVGYNDTSDLPDPAVAYFSSLHTPVSAWSPDGLRHVWASPDDVLTFYVNIQYPEGGSMGYTADLLSEKIPQKVKEFVWIDETTLFIVCYTNEIGLEYFATYDTDKQKITHWSTGKNGYEWSDGKIVIPD